MRGLHSNVSLGEQWGMESDSDAAWANVGMGGNLVHSRARTGGENTSDGE